MGLKKKKKKKKKNPETSQMKEQREYLFQYQKASSKPHIPFRNSLINF